jgi:hypothetical protein
VKVKTGQVGKAFIYMKRGGIEMRRGRRLIDCFATKPIDSSKNQHENYHR